jgi:hypothetical protein
MSSTISLFTNAKEDLSMLTVKIRANIVADQPVATELISALISWPHEKMLLLDTTSEEQRVIVSSLLSNIIKCNSEGKLNVMMKEVINEGKLNLSQNYKKHRSISGFMQMHS